MSSSLFVLDPSSLFFSFMPLSPALALLFTAVLFLFFYPGGIAWALSRTTKPNIPGPPGNVSALSTTLAHRVLAKLASSLGATRLMAFSVGLTRFIVSSHPETAKEILNGSAFADRPVKESAYELLFHRAMGFAPFGDYWRTLRRISSTHLFSPKRLSASAEQRKLIGDQMVEEIRRTMKKDGKVEIRKVLHYASLNNVMMSVFGKSYDFEQGEGAELEAMVREGYELLGAFNWGDHLPFLRWLDLQGVRRRCRNLVKKVDGFVGGIIQEHRSRRSQNKDRINDNGEGDAAVGDFVDVLLDLEGEDKLSDSDMVAVLWEMIFRGTDTVAILLEWVMARMVLHPDIQSTVQAEIDTVTSTKSDRPLQQQHLPYLQSVVKETLRLHPPGPLLSWARLAIHDVHVGDYLIPAGTTAMVNMWSITHDESIWHDSDKYIPERFLNEEVSVLGSDLRLAPFGSGRRVCPGKSMGLAAVHLWLAQLLKEFQWVTADDAEVDLSECLKMSMEMKNPLVCRAVPRC